MYAKILVGYDGRERSEDALALARSLAEALGAELVIASIYPHDPFPRTYIAEYEAHLRRDTEELLVKLRSGFTGNLQTRAEGATSPARGLHDLAEEESADLIVIGSSAHGALGRILAGSTGQSLLRGAPCAVAVAPASFASTEGAFRSLAVAFDGSPEADVALRAAETLAGRLDASLLLLTVVRPPDFGAVLQYTGSGTAANYSYTDHEEHTRERMRAVLDGALEAVPSEVEARGKLLSGDPADEISRHVDQRVDLLVTGSRGYGPLKRVLLGGFATELIHSSPCPVLVVPRGAPVDAGSQMAAG